jgi:C4-dicarboxylate-specific signal transduction histidine kinase
MLSNWLPARCRTYKVTIGFPAVTEPVMVIGDSIQLSQVVLNLVRNAFDAMQSSARKEIHFSCFREDGWGILKVRDSGEGLTADALEQIGTPFFTGKAEGLGMGLLIPHSIAEQHSGSLLIANAENGYGAIVVLTLPSMPN